VTTPGQQPKPDEFDLIARYFAPLAGEGALGLKDDAATLLPRPGFEFVVTKDAVVSGIHFFPEDAPSSVARKALRVNLSDLAAKGAGPVGFMLALGLGNGWDEAWVKEFAQGLEQDCQSFGASVLGGDTFRTGGPFIVSVTAIGEIPQGNYVSRLGANADDEIFVTGSVGDAALGLQVRMGQNLQLVPHERDHLLDRYLIPQPRLDLAPALRSHASACMDISDGLLGDAQKLANASDCGMVIEAKSVPLSDAARSSLNTWQPAMETILTGGDDYELLITAPASRKAEFLRDAVEAGLSLTHIGQCTKNTGHVEVLDCDGKPMQFQSMGYCHTDYT